VYNVQPSLQREAQLPPQLPRGDDRDDDGNEWWSDDEDINLTVLRSRPTATAPPRIDPPHQQQQTAMED
jgi:hypothetical protein